MLPPLRFVTLGFPILATILVLLTGCVDNTRPDDGPPPDLAALELLAQNKFQEASAAYLELADNSKAPLKQDYQLRAADALIDAQDFVNARRIAESLSQKGLTKRHNTFRRIVLGRIALAQNDPTQALEWLTGRDTIVPDTELLMRYHTLRADALEQTEQFVAAAAERTTLDGYLDRTARETNRRRIWSDLSKVTTGNLGNALGGPNVSLNGWIDLAIIAKRFITDAVIFEGAVTDWGLRFVDHPASFIVPELLSASLIDTTPPEHIALLLPLDGTFAKAATAVRDGFMAAWFDDAGNPERPKVSVWNTADKDINSVYTQAIEAGADFVVGPLDKPSVTALVRSTPVSVSTLALNYADETSALIREASAETGGEVSQSETIETIPTGILYQFALSPEDEARRVAERAWFEGFGKVALVAPEGNWGYRVGNAFIDAWTELGGVVVDQKSYESNAPDMSPPISALLGVDQSRQRYRDVRRTLGLDLKHETRRRRDVDFIFMAAFPRQARLLRPQLRFHRAADLPVFATSHVYAGVPDPAADADIDGVWFGDMPWVLVEGGAHGSLRLESERAWGAVFARYARLYAFGVDAYVIVPQLGQLRAQPSTELEGETGWLSVDETSRVRRRLHWAFFLDGLPKLLDTQELEN